MARAALGAMLGLALVGPACAKPAPIVPIELSRVGKWELNYDKDSCHLFGQFGEGDDKIVARFTRYQPDNELEFRAYGKAVGTAKAGQRYPLTPVFFNQGPDFQKERFALLGSSGETPMAMYGSLRLDNLTRSKPDEALPPIAPAQEAAVTQITFQAPDRQWYRLKFNAMGSAMASMRQCTLNLVASWGFDLAVMKTLTSLPRPAGNPGAWLTTADYPPKMLRSGQISVVRFRLSVDEKGAATDCFIQEAAGKREFSAISCGLLKKRARFIPAKDAKGNAVPAYYINSVRWMLPN